MLAALIAWITFMPTFGICRGLQVMNARGRYFYADFCNGTFWSFVIQGGQATGMRRENFHVTLPTSFGEDTRGELYVVNLNGQVYKLTSF